MLDATLATIHQDVIRDRRHLHANPELAFEETGTAAFVAGRLGELGLRSGPASGGPES